MTVGAGIGATDRPVGWATGTLLCAATGATAKTFDTLGAIPAQQMSVEQMQAVDTRGVEPMSHAQDVYQRLRADVVTETDQREKFQAIAPQVEEGLYLVPQVIE